MSEPTCDFCEQVKTPLHPIGDYLGCKPCIGEIYDEIEQDRLLMEEEE